MLAIDSRIFKIMNWFGHCHGCRCCCCLWLLFIKIILSFEFRLAFTCYVMRTPHTCYIYIGVFDDSSSHPLHVKVKVFVFVSILTLSCIPIVSKPHSRNKKIIIKIIGHCFDRQINVSADAFYFSAHLSALILSTMSSVCCLQRSIYAYVDEKYSFLVFRFPK